jgi:hypothetical protein
LINGHFNLDSVSDCKEVIGNMCNLNLKQAGAATYSNKPEIEQLCSDLGGHVPRVTTQEELDIVNAFRHPFINDWRQIWVSLTTDNIR